MADTYCTGNYWELLALFDISAWYLHSHHSIWPGCSQEEKSLKMQCNHIPSSLIEISNNYSGHRFSAYLHNDWNKMLKLYNQMWDMQRKPKHSIDTTHLFFPYHMDQTNQICSSHRDVYLFFTCRWHRGGHGDLSIINI